jgi:hypothetical protein
MLRLELITRLLLYCAALLGYLPLAPYLQRLPFVAVPAAIIFSAVAARRGLLLKERPALLIAAGCFCYYALQFNHHNVARPAAAMLAILLAIRIAGERNARNFLQTVTLALFCLAASTLFDLSPGFLVYLALLLLIFSVSLVLLTFQSSAPAFRPAAGELRTIVLTALLQPLTALPLIILLFFILPRTQLPLWQGFTVAGSSNTGVSDKLEPGDRSAVQTGSAVVFRAEMPQLPPEKLYWRATVLNAIDGSSWVRRQPPDRPETLPSAGSLTQTIFLEPGRPVFLPVLNVPGSISGTRGGAAADRVFRAAVLGGRRSYSAVSQIKDAPLPAAAVDLKFYTVLPEHVPPRLLALARDIAAREQSGEARLRLLRDTFIGLRLSYAATGLPTGPDALDRFLFDGKKGHCELFATAFATALRAAGVPARLVGGYFGGEYNELAGYYAVSEDRAHVWVEVWLAGKGWLTVDPSSFAANFAEARRLSTAPLLLRLRLAADTLSYYWNRAVITYDMESQLSAVSRAGAELRGLSSGSLPLRRIVAGSGWLLLLAALIYLLAGRKATTEERLLAAFRRRLHAGYGLDLGPATGLHEGIRGIDCDPARRFADIYTGAIYRDRKLTAAEIAELRRLLQEIPRRR